MGYVPGSLAGRIGRDAHEFRIFAGSTDLVRGNTSGSYRRNECLEDASPDDTETGCAELDRLVGTQLALGSFELRMPLFNPSTSGAVILPPMEIAAFYERMGAVRVGEVPSASIPGRVLPAYRTDLSSTV